MVTDLCSNLCTPQVINFPQVRVLVYTTLQHTSETCKLSYDNLNQLYFSKTELHRSVLLQNDIIPVMVIKSHFTNLDQIM